MERLSGLDASFLYLETARMHMHVSLVAVLDPTEAPGGYSFDRIQELIADRIHLLPPFRRRLVRVPFDLHHPVWVEDPEFDIIHHVRRVSAPAPGGRRELASLVGRITSSPLDRGRPLWEVWVIEGLKRGRYALVTKVHHAAVDGVTGASLLAHLFDLGRDAVAAPKPPPAPPDPIPTDRELVQHALLSRARQPVGMWKLARQTVKAARDVVRVRRDPETPVGATPLTAPRTRFNGSIGAQRAVAFSRVPLPAIKELKKRAGTTVNDVVLAVCAGALRRYLEAHEELPDAPLIATCPISVHGASRGPSSNKVSAMFTSLATHVDDPRARLLAIAATTRGAKEEHNAVGADMLQNWAEFAAPTTFNLASRFYSAMNLADKHRPIHNLVISNVPGPPFPLYLAGADLVAIYPMGPVMEGAGLNVTVLSYRGAVDFGFNASQSMAPDLWALAEAVPPAFDELAGAF
ncbi:MAG: wax ester/triacylglycerol synthase family O-acyltransferase [Polyangiaceae bacterium]|nr:wax ester/triacylglycerol synthase family O-acyltransferase [Polyangiaceae bacterium]